MENNIVVIDRAKWNSGKRYSPKSYLINEEGYKCCLGFLGTACDVDDVSMKNQSFPSYIHNFPWPENLFDVYEDYKIWEDVFASLNDYTSTIISFNDVECLAIDDSDREAWIAAGFEIVLGKKVEFAGEYLK